ncbi:MAG TPA: tetratricopeptide repeat protein [Bacteroidetes bacterium]|nr:tetratricopeptide repeat protein [Bacteroidota bacterium]
MKRLKRIHFLILILTLPLFIYAQSIEKKFDESISLGDFFMEKEEYELALPYYQQAHLYNIDDTEAIFKIAEAYRKLRKYDQAEEWYLNLALTTDVPYPMSVFWIGKMLQNQGRYFEAKMAFQDFELIYPESDAYRLRCDVEISNCNKAIYLKANALKVRISPLKKKIEKEGLWGFSRLDSTGFAFRVSLKPARGKYKEVKTKYLNAQPVDSMRYLDLIKINPYSGESVGLGWDDINTDFPGEIVGLPVFDDNNEFSVAVFKDKKRYRQLYSSKKINEKWSKWQKIKGLYNKKIIYADPFVTSESKSFNLYYSARKDGGKGGYDIYACKLNDAGEWESDIYIPNVNTLFNDRFPVYIKKTSTFYFSSEGLSGLGGLDIYKMLGNLGGAWDDPVNIGYPINTSFDDFAYYPLDSIRSVFSSNRVKKGKDPSFDQIYEVDFRKEANYLIVDIDQKLTSFTDEYTWEISKTELFMADKKFNKMNLYKPHHNGLYYLNDLQNYIAEIKVKGENKAYVFEISPRRHTITFREDSITMHFSVKENELITENELPSGFTQQKISHQDTVKEVSVKIEEEPKQKEKLDPNKKKSETLKEFKDAIETLQPKQNQDIFYSIQLGAFGRPRLEYFNNTLNMTDVFEQERKAVYRYYTGKYSSFDSVLTACRNLRASFSKGVFVVAFQKNERIIIAEARKLLKQ